MNQYREMIYSKETNREAFARFARSCQIVKTAAGEGRPQVIVDYNGDTDSVAVKYNGNTLFEDKGEDLWGKTLLELRRRNYRGEFGKNPMFVNVQTMTDPKTGEASTRRFDITKQVVNMR